MNRKTINGCKLCARNCNVNREAGKKGFCMCDDKIKVSLVSTHYYEEPCISKENGSGTIFFSNCNLKCIYCQNYNISQNGFGKEITTNRLAKIMLEQQEKNVNNINLVTPTTYVYQIIEAIKIARNNGLSIPIIYNTNSYENVETIQMLKGYIDVYLPDLKYCSNILSEKYSNAPNYFEVAKRAIIEMYNQVGKIELDERGIIKKGVIVRHLILPNHMQNTKNILKWLKENMPNDIYISIMAQYFPTYKAKEDALLNRKLTKKEYKIIESYVYSLDIKNGYMQELGNHEEEYVPCFDLSNV